MQPRPPAKGSFPLDHLAECKQFAVAYETCLEKHNKLTRRCRQEARQYLECRMQRGLMAQEGWDKLGLGDDKLEVGATAKGAGEPDRRQAEAGGFVAGARTARRRKERHAGATDGVTDG